MFSDGERSGKECPKCEYEMVFELSFQDQFSYTTGHYTTDVHLVVCPNCDYSEEYFEDETGE